MTPEENWKSLEYALSMIQRFFFPEEANLRINVTYEALLLRLVPNLSPHTKKKTKQLPGI